MTDTDQLPPLPEPEGVIVVGTQALRGFTADQMRAYALQARTQVQGDPSWWMRETDEGAEWTDTAPLVLSGWTPLYTNPQPAQATQADVTDEQINAVALEQWGPHAGGPLAAHRAFARAILAMRPEKVPMTGEQWTDVLGSAGPDLLDLAKQWSDNKVHVYQVVNEAEKIVKAAVLRGITAQIKKETP